jgi:hypothetical protein
MMAKSERPSPKTSKSLAQQLRTKPLFPVKMSSRMRAPYYFDLFYIPLIALFTWLWFLNVEGVDKGLPSTASSNHTFAFLAVYGFYGIRLAAWLNMLRRRNMPQVGEWLLTLGGLVSILPLFIFSPQLTEAYAGAHGYRFCGPVAEHREVSLVFAKRGQECPRLLVSR